MVKLSGEATLPFFSSPGQSPKRAIVLTPGIGVGVGVSKKFNVKVFYVMGKALSVELSCPCDRSCSQKMLTLEGKNLLL